MYKKQRGEKRKKLFQFPSVIRIETDLWTQRKTSNSNEKKREKLSIWDTHRNWLSCDRLEAHEPDRLRAHCWWCCVGELSPLEIQKDSNPIAGWGDGDPRRSSSSDKSPPGLPWPEDGCIGYEFRVGESPYPLPSSSEKASSIRGSVCELPIPLLKEKNYDSVSV